ncbi:MAG TPA: hypothetical protein VF614_13565 [Chthoniobacteraceae bacterium]|jgi:hypothetical protein
MLAQGAASTFDARLPFLLCGALGGYLLLMCTNPVRSSFRDGLRALGRYRTLWVALGTFGFAYALFQIALRAYFASALPPGMAPTFTWMRAAWRDPDRWLSGSPESLWWLPRGDFRAVLRDSVMPALDSLSGLFNWLVTTFPLAAVAAVLLFINWENHHVVLWRALRKRFGMFALLVHAGILLCALAALVKPFIYVAPSFIQAQDASTPSLLETWIVWSPVVEWLAFLFEYLFGVCIQIYLILLAYVWVRGLTFTREHLLDFAIRRFSFVVKWAAVIMVLSSVLINAPMILRHFEPFSAWFPEEEIFSDALPKARAALAVFILFGATIQITLTFHSESLRKAMRDHARFVFRNWWPFGWFLVVAALHFYALHVLQLSVARGVGEGTALWVAWMLLFPWLGAYVAGWLLASWVCVFKRCDTGRAANDNWLHR